MRVRSSGEASNPLIEVNPTQPYGPSSLPAQQKQLYKERLGHTGKGLGHRRMPGLSSLVADCFQAENSVFSVVMQDLAGNFTQEQWLCSAYFP